MEIHRLKEMQDDYDEELFNKIYKGCSKLMDKLTFGINPLYYGVTTDIIRSWFDDKFIYVYNKYYGEMSDKSLKSHIIKALQQFRCRVLRGAYTQHSEKNIEMVRLDDEEYQRYNMDVIDEIEPEVDEELLSKIKDFMKQTLSEDAYFLFNLQLNPPPMVLSHDKESQDAKWAAFLNLPQEESTYIYFDKLREEIQRGTKRCRNKFKDQVTTK